MSSTVAAAWVGAIVSLVVAVVSGWYAQRQARSAQEASAQLQDARLRTELRTEFQAEETIRLLLEHPDYQLRTFAAIKRRIRGFDDDELRQLLVRAGAVAFERREDGAELWGLRHRNIERM